MFSEGDRVVYAPHGAGTVVATKKREGSGEEYLSIRIEHSKLTLMVPAANAEEKGVRRIVDADGAQALLDEIGGDPEPLADNPQMRTRRAQDIVRGGHAIDLAVMLRDYSAVTRGGKRLSATEQRMVATATQMLASELALAEDTDIASATERVEQAMEQVQG